MGLVGVLQCYLRPAVATEVYFEETFNTPDWKHRWVHSNWHGVEGPSANFEWGTGPGPTDSLHPPEAYGIETTTGHSYNGISAKFPPFHNRGQELVVQFSVRHWNLEWSWCGGGYIKILPPEFDQEDFGDHTKYFLMFGPNICGYDPAHLHLTIHEKGKYMHNKEPPMKYNHSDHKKHTRFYTLHLKPDDTYHLYIDYIERISGKLRDHYEFAPELMDDPKDKKPRKWDDREHVHHPDHVNKPHDWHDEKMIPDPTVVMPVGWDEEEDGPWRPPMVENPEYIGVWKKKKMPNANYQGEWQARQVPHPEYRSEVHHFDDEIGGIGFEIWTAHPGTVFDNVLLTDDIDYAREKFEEFLPVLKAEEAWFKESSDRKIKARYQDQYMLWHLPEEELEEEMDDEGEDDGIMGDDTMEQDIMGVKHVKSMYQGKGVNVRSAMAKDAINERRFGDNSKEDPSEL